MKTPVSYNTNTIDPYEVFLCTHKAEICVH